MFEHGKTKQKYYSIREKINYYKKVIKGSIVVPAVVKRKAKIRLRTLTKLNNRDFNEPTLVVTDDKVFGNKISKPRLSVVIDKDDNRLLVLPIYHRTTNQIILDNEPERQIDIRKRWIDKSNVYEDKYIIGAKSLTRYDKKKISLIWGKKNTTTY